MDHRDRFHSQRTTRSSVTKGVLFVKQKTVEFNPNSRKHIE